MLDDDFGTYVRFHPPRLYGNWVDSDILLRGISTTGVVFPSEPVTVVNVV